MEDLLTCHPDVVSVAGRGVARQRFQVTGMQDFDALRQSIRLAVSLHGGPARDRAADYLAYFDAKYGLIKTRLARLSGASDRARCTARGTVLLGASGARGGPQIQWAAKTLHPDLAQMRHEPGRQPPALVGHGGRSRHVMTSRTPAAVSKHAADAAVAGRSARTALVEIRNVSFAHAGQGHGLHEVSLAVRETEVCCLLGPNGAAKSTLPRCLLSAARSACAAHVSGSCPAAARPPGCLRSACPFPSLRWVWR